MGEYFNREWCWMALVTTVLGMSTINRSWADALDEWFYADELGNQLGQAAQAHADYRAERELWKNNIAAAKAELKRCGGCASAQAELNKWGGIENKFQDIAGSLAASSGMPPAAAKLLGINMPMTPGWTEAQRQEACGIHRDASIDDLPEYCRIVVDEYFDCLRQVQRDQGFCNWQGAGDPGGRCWNQKKLSNHCRNSDQAAFEREKALQEARATGAIIPEYIPGHSSLILYGRVPDDFMPNLPPPDAVKAKLKSKKNVSLSLIMEKNAVGKLSEIKYRRNFHFRLVDPNTKCFSVDRPTDEINRRTCEDIYDIAASEFPDGITLICSYFGNGLVANEYLPEFIYWYGSRPPLADQTRLLGRSHEHPILRIGDPRTECPSTQAEANEDKQQYNAKLANLRDRVPQIQSGVKLPDSERTQKMREEEKQRTKHLLSNMHLEGTYKTEFMSLRYGKKSKYVPCTITKIENNKFQIHCKETRRRTSSIYGQYQGVGFIKDGEFVVNWDDFNGRKLKMSYNATTAWTLIAQPENESFKHIMTRVYDPGLPQNTATQNQSPKPVRQEQRAASASGKPTSQPSVWDQLRTIRSELSGKWHGAYMCKHFETGVDLTLETKPDAGIIGELSFYPLTNPRGGHRSGRIQPGSFKVTAFYDTSTGMIQLKPGEWLVQPRGYTARGLKGIYLAQHGVLVAEFDEERDSHMCSTLVATNDSDTSSLTTPPETSDSNVVSSGGLTCEAIVNWLGNLTREYPEMNAAHVSVSTLHQRAYPLFYDDLFIPVFGTAFDAMDAADLKSVKKPFLKCARSYQRNPEVKQREIGATLIKVASPFYATTGSFSSTEVAMRIQYHRILAAWQKTIKLRLKAINYTDNDSEGSLPIAPAGEQLLKYEWPSTRQKFEEMVASARN